MAEKTPDEIAQEAARKEYENDPYVLESKKKNPNHKLQQETVDRAVNSLREAWGLPNN